MQGKYMLRSTKYSALCRILRLQTSLGQQNPRLAHAFSCTGHGTDAPRCPQICLYRRKNAAAAHLGQQNPRLARAFSCTGHGTDAPRCPRICLHRRKNAAAAPFGQQSPRLARADSCTGRGTDAPRCPGSACTGEKRRCCTPCAAKPAARPPFFMCRARYRCPAAPASCPNSM